MYLELLQQLSHHTQWHRQRGHTTALLQGALATTEAMVLVSDQQQGQYIRGLAEEITQGRLGLRPDRILTLPNAAERLMGTHRPLLIDHHALEVLLEGALREMREMVSRAREG